LKPCIDKELAKYFKLTDVEVHAEVVNNNVVLIACSMGCAEVVLIPCSLTGLFFLSVQPYLAQKVCILVTETGMLVGV
jgi:hypothetical protein